MQTGLEYLQRRRLHNLSKLPVPELHHSYSHIRYFRGNARELQFPTLCRNPDRTYQMIVNTILHPQGRKRSQGLMTRQQTRKLNLRDHSQQDQPLEESRESTASKSQIMCCGKSDFHLRGPRILGGTKELHCSTEEPSQ